MREDDEIGACMGILANGAWLGRLGDVRKRESYVALRRAVFRRVGFARVGFDKDFTGALC